MKINFTKKEYRRLIAMLEISDWIMTSNDTVDSEKRPEVKPYMDLIQKLYSYSKQMDCENLIEYMKEVDKYYPTLELEDSEIRDFIDEYDQHTFWNELPIHLALRDLVEDVGIDKLKNMEPREQSMKRWEIESIYEDEFSRSGIENLRLVNGKKENTH